MGKVACRRLALSRPLLETLAAEWVRPNALAIGLRPRASLLLSNLNDQAALLVARAASRKRVARGLPL